MENSITNGVKLLVQPTTKFQTNLIECHFFAKIEQATFTEMNLLSRILMSGCQQYPQRDLLASRLADLYGANLQVTQRALGQYHDLMVRIAFVEPQRPTVHNLPDILTLLQQVIFSPLLTSTTGAEAFAIERQAYASELRDLQEDYEFQAFAQTKKTYFQQTALNEHYQSPAAGTLAELEQVSYERLQRLYQEICQQWQVELVVLTNEPTSLDWPVLLQQALPFTPRPARINDDLAISAPVATSQVQQQSIAGQQSRLVLAYQVSAVTSAAQQQRLVLLARILGGSEQSLLFQTVREKLGLVYDISASYDYLTGWLLIEAGLDQQNIALAQTTIEQAWQQIAAGQVPASLIDLAQREMISQRRLIVDSPQRLSNRALLQTLQPAWQRSSAAYQQAFAAVDPAYLGRLCQQISLRVTTILRGQEAH